MYLVSCLKLLEVLTYDRIWWEWHNIKSVTAVVDDGYADDICQTASDGKTYSDGKTDDICQTDTI